jgi:hypothetical protein
VETHLGGGGGATSARGVVTTGTFGSELRSGRGAAGSQRPPTPYRRRLPTRWLGAAQLATHPEDAATDAAQLAGGGIADVSEVEGQRWKAVRRRSGRGWAESGPLIGLSIAISRDCNQNHPRVLRLAMARPRGLLLAPRLHWVWASLWA